MVMAIDIMFFLGLVCMNHKCSNTSPVTRTHISTFQIPFTLSGSWFTDLGGLFHPKEGIAPIVSPEFRSKDQKRYKREIPAQHFRQHNQRTTMSRPGGTTNARPIDEQALQVAQSAKAGIEEKAGQTYSTFNPTQYATQVSQKQHSAF